MTTSRSTFALSKPEGREPVPPGVLQYMQTRNRMHLFTLVQKEFERVGITQAELSDRLDKGTDVVCRFFGAPGNWGLDTVSDYLWAISGAEIDYKLTYPLEKAPRNDTRPHWLNETKAFTYDLPKIDEKLNQGRIQETGSPIKKVLEIEIAA